MIDVEATCARCARPYYTEHDDNGLCCICNRDDRFTALLGPDWRRLVRERPNERPQ